MEHVVIHDPTAAAKFIASTEKVVTFEAAKEAEARRAERYANDPRKALKGRTYLPQVSKDGKFRRNSKGVVYLVDEKTGTWRKVGYQPAPVEIKK